MKKFFALFLAIGMLMASFSALAEDTPETPIVYMRKAPSLDQPRKANTSPGG